MLHRTTKGLTKRRLNEDLVLDGRVKVHGQVVQYLTWSQLYGIRFLYKHYAERSSCILNDEKYLGKCFQTAVFLSSITHSNKATFRCLILCKSYEKLLNWLYHIELLTDLNAVEFKSITDFQHNNILVQLLEEIQHKPNLFTTKLWDYVIFDETGENKFTDNDISVLKQIETKVKLVVSTDDIVRNVRHLKRLLVLINQNDNDVIKRISSKFGKSRDNIQLREILIVHCKSFVLRRFVRELKIGLPLTDSVIHQNNFSSWRKIRGFMPTFKDLDETEINPSNIVSNSDNTEEMAPLVLESDSDDEFDDLRDWKIVRSKSSELEIFTQKLPSPIMLSSEQTYRPRPSSPDLFESLDEDDSEKTVNYDLTGSLFKFKTKLNNDKMSTPILSTLTTQWSSLKQQNSDDLFDGITSMIDDDDVGNGKLYEESNHTCVFEITKNDEFPNVIRINSDTEMSPIVNHKNVSTNLASGTSSNTKIKHSFEDQKSNKHFHYFFDNGNVHKSPSDAESVITNSQCVTPKSTKTPNTSGSSSNSHRWITKSTSSVKRKLSESFEKIQSKRLKNHVINKLQDNPGIVKNKARTSLDLDQLTDSSSIVSKKIPKGKFKRFLSHALASSDEEL